MDTAIAIFAGFILDLLFGDPYWMPHPIRAMGAGIGLLEKKLRRPGQSPQAQFCSGLLLVCIMVLLSALVPAALLFLACRIHPAAGIVLESFMCYQILATKCLKTESMKVCKALREGDVEKARTAVSMIVGRDTAVLSEEGIIKAAVETVAENTSDGSIAPLCFLLLGGPVAGFAYKAVNTMDSMLGYKNEKYLYFGRAAARLDDVVNFIPSRLAAWAMIAASRLCGLDAAGAYRIWKRDRFCHVSPNSAQTESVCAGALGVALAGDAVYFGKTVKKTLYRGRPPLRGGGGYRQSQPAFVRIRRDNLAGRAAASVDTLRRLGIIKFCPPDYDRNLSMNGQRKKEKTGGNRYGFF